VLMAKVGSDAQDAMVELSALIARAKQLMGSMDASKTRDLSQPLHSSPGGSMQRHQQPLASMRSLEPVQEVRHPRCLQWRCLHHRVLPLDAPHSACAFLR
jgi:hypothetical protein